MKKSSIYWPACSVLSGVMLFSCAEQPQPRAPEPPKPVAEKPAGTTDSEAPEVAGWKVSTSTDDPTVAECGGMLFTKPARWMWTTPTMRFRALQYTVPGRDGTPEAALIFSVFKEGDGGPVQMNIDRWIGQFRPTGDIPPRVERSSLEIDGMKVWLTELEGSYAGMGAAAPRAGWAQLGAIIEAPGRNIYIRLLGPSKTVLENHDAFNELVRSAKPAK